MINLLLFKLETTIPEINVSSYNVCGDTKSIYDNQIKEIDFLKRMYIISMYRESLQSNFRPDFDKKANTIISLSVFEIVFY